MAPDNDALLKSVPKPPLDPAFAAEPINWPLLGSLAKKHHPVVTEGWWEWAQGQDGYQGEMAQEHVVAHHLIDMLGVPCPLPSVGGAGHPADLDARVWRAVAGAFALLGRLGRISDWHSRETGPHGMVGDRCTECGLDWPCDTRRMADGTYEDHDEAALTGPSPTEENT
jgi:hypothetical protein